MRPIETIQLVVVVLAVLLPVAFGRRLRRGRMAVGLAVVLVAQVALEGYRWQLLPLHVTSLGLAIGDALRFERRVRGFPRFRRATLGTVGVLLVALAPMVAPLPVIPEPDGPFDIGTQTFVLVDTEREESYGRPEEAPEGTTGTTTSNAGERGEVPSGPRRVVVQVWYPAGTGEDPESGDGRAKPGAWNPDWDVVGEAVAGEVGLPGFSVGHLAGVAGHAVEGAAPLEGRFPVVVSSHGWKGFRTINLAQIESLASRGFIVVAPDHTYGSVATVFPATAASPEEVVRSDPRALPDPEEVDEDDYAEAAETLVETFADDLSFVLDNLESGSLGPFGAIADHADLQAVGAVGHGVGGGAAVRMCLSDDRCRAVLGLDPWVEPVPDRLVARELQIPSLFIRSDDTRGTAGDRRLQGLAERSPSVSYWIGIDGAGRLDFTLVPLVSPVGDRFGWTGTIQADRVMTIIDTYLTDFFDRHLQDVGGGALEMPPPPEVSFEVFE